MADMSLTKLDWKLQRRFNWEVILPETAGGPSGFDMGKYVQSVKFGDYNILEISRIRYGAYRKGYAGFLDIGTATLRFLNPVPDVVSAYFRAWKNQIVDRRGLFFPKNNYARNMEVRLLDRDGSEVNSYTLKGVFPRSFPMFDLDYANGDVNTFDIEFNVDKLDF